MWARIFHFVKLAFIASHLDEEITNEIKCDLHLFNTLL